MIQYLYFDMFVHLLQLVSICFGGHCLSCLSCICCDLLLSPQPFVFLLHCHICWWCLLLPPLSMFLLLLFSALTDAIVRYLCVQKHLRAVGWNARYWLLVTFLLILAMLNFHWNTTDVAAAVAAATLTLHGSNCFFHVNWRKHIRAFAIHISTYIYLILYLCSLFYGKIMLFPLNRDTRSRTQIEPFMSIRLAKCKILCEKLQITFVHKKW